MVMNVDQSQFIRFLMLGEDSEVVQGSCIKNVNKGVANITFRGINSYGGISTVSFKIEITYNSGFLEVS